MRSRTKIVTREDINGMSIIECRAALAMAAVNANAIKPEYKDEFLLRCALISERLHRIEWSALRQRRTEGYVMTNDGRVILEAIKDVESSIRECQSVISQFPHIKLEEV